MGNLTKRRGQNGKLKNGVLGRMVILAEEEEEKRKQMERAVRRRSGTIGSLLGVWRRLTWLFLIGCCGGGMSTIVSGGDGNGWCCGGDGHTI